MEQIVESIRLHNIHALLVIGGFEVRGLEGERAGSLGRRTKWPRASVSLLAQGPDQRALSGALSSGGMSL